jgi:hypothetical protein
MSSPRRAGIGTLIGIALGVVAVRRGTTIGAIIIAGGHR